MMARRKNYPANLLYKLQVNEKTGSNIDYDNMTFDQLQGLEYVLEQLTEREKVVIQMYYEEGFTKKEIANRFEVTDRRIHQILEKVYRKLRAKEKLLFYVVNGYEVMMGCLQEQLTREEKRYCNVRGIRDKDHLYYQKIACLDLSTRVYHALCREGIATVRDLIVSICSSQRIRNLGDLSCSLVKRVLEEENLIPRNFETCDCPRDLPKRDVELRVFMKLNSYSQSL